MKTKETKNQVNQNKKDSESVKSIKVTNPTKSKSKKVKGSKAEVKEIPATKSKKKKDQVVKEVAEKQKASIREKVTSEREVKYYYPSDEELLKQFPDRPNSSIKDLKKAWRQDVRNKYRKLEREMNRFIQDQSSKEYKAAKEAFEKYTSKVLKPGMAI